MPTTDTEFFDQLASAKQRTKESPDDWRSWEALYVTWARVGAVSRAVQALRRSVALAPPTSNIHARAVGFYVGTRDHEVALQAAEDLLKHNPADTHHLILALRCALACDAAELVSEWAQLLANQDPEQTLSLIHI